MNIAFILNEPVQNATGGYKMIYMYANSLAKKGHKISIYYRCRKEKLFSNFNILFFIKFLIALLLAKFGPIWFKLDNKINRYVIKNINNKSIKNNDIIIATAVDTAKEVNLLDMSKGKKCYFIQDFENWEYEDCYVYETYNLGMENIVVSKWLKDLVEEKTSKSCKIISNGINTNVFFNKNNKREKHSIVMHFRDVNKEYKGGIYAIECIKRLKEIYSDLKVSIISTDERTEIIPDYCMYYKSISPKQVAEINNKSEVFICTSINEGFGLPGLEAMSCGCAVCSFAYKGVYEYAIDNYNSLLSNVRDVDEMVDNVRKLFEDENLMKEISLNGIKTGLEKSHDIMCDELEFIFMELLK